VELNSPLPPAIYCNCFRVNKRNNILLIHNCTIRYIHTMETNSANRLSEMVGRTKIKILR